MKRLFATLTLALSVFAGTALFTLPTHAADSGAAAENQPAKKVRARPVTGKVDVIDSEKKTITLSGEKKQVLHVTAETKMMKAGKPATFDDITVGEVIGGSVIEEDGKLILNSLRIGPKPESDKPAKKKKETE